MDSTFTYQKIKAYKLKMACSNRLTYCFLLFLSLIGSSIAASPSDDLLAWVQQDNRRFLNAIIRVTNLNRTIKFYTENFGMKVLRQSDIPHENYSYAVLGFGPEDSHFVLQLRQNYGGEKLKLGTAFAHFGIATQDAYKMVEEIRARGGVITREAGPIEGGTTVFAFIQDPDGYMFELIQRPPTPEPLCQLMLHFAIAMVGYGSNLTQITTVELRYNYNVTEYTEGNGYVQVAINTDDVYKSAAAVELVSQELGGNITQGPDPISKTTSFLDPDGFKTVLVGNRRKKE
ncbi:Glyoxalase/fosfomycin resistance/dioxygenase domain - like 7 [Theobroma cacao]|nr:Glyoxalase/fosfomycin resistance/dioxygenase domain - like 7 [Theobroma cacao]